VLAEALRDPDPHFWAATFLRVTALQAADFERAARCLDTMRILSGQLQQPTMMWGTTWFEAGDALVSGDPDRVEALATTALEVGTETGQPDALNIYGGQLAWAHLQRGRLGELLPMMEQMDAENPGLPSVRAGMALGYLESGDPEKARQLLQRAADDNFESLPLDIAWIVGVAIYADVAIELRAEGPARKLATLLAPYHEQIPFGGAIALNPVAFYLGGLASVLAQYERAEAYFAEATALNSRGRMKYAEARTHLEWGRMLIVRGGADSLSRARTLLVLAGDAASTHGYGMVGRRTEATLARLAST
jgi:hypothetical protein